MPGGHEIANLANMTIWSTPLLHGAGILLALEILYWVLRRLLPEFNVRFAYHLWAVTLALLFVLVAIEFDRDTLYWKLTASTAAVLSAWVVFAVLSAAVIKRPWTPDKPFLPKLARDVLRIGLLIAVGLAAANLILGVELGAIVVSSTVLSAVAGLALQDVLKNFFAGMALDVEKPFTRGDWLMLDGETPVEVMDLGWRTVHLRTREGVDIFEPNTGISNARLFNYGPGDQPRALAFRISLSQDTLPVDAKRALEKAASSIPDILPEPPVSVFLESFGDDSITYHLRAWTRAVSLIDEVRDAVNARVWHELHRRRLTLPTPMRDLKIQRTSSVVAERNREQRRRVSKRLARIGLFDDLNPDTLRTLADGARVHHYDSGEVLVRDGDTGESLFVIESGTIVVSKSPEAGAPEVDVGRLQAGDFFGEQSLLTGEPRNATLRADGGCTVFEIDKPLLAHLLAADPEVAEILSHALAARDEITAASLERHHDRMRGQRKSESSESILRRMRAFFGLGK